MLAVGREPLVGFHTDTPKLRLCLCPSQQTAQFAICPYKPNIYYIPASLTKENVLSHLSPHVFFYAPVFSVDTTSVADNRNNPSIGEGSVGGMTGSLSASGSHMDRLGAIRDNLSETASTMALAGASITGSLSGSAMVNYLNRY